MLSNTSQTKYKIFCYGLSQTLRRSCFFWGDNIKNFFSAREQRHNIQKNDTIMTTKTAMNTNIATINQETLFNKVGFPYVVPVEGLKHVHSYIKKPILCRKSSNCAVSRKFKQLYKKLESSAKRYRSSVVTGGLCNTISRNSSIGKQSKLSQIISGRKYYSQKEIHEMLSKGAIVETPNHLGGEFISTLSLVEKDGGTNQ